MVLGSDANELELTVLQVERGAHGHSSVRVAVRVRLGEFAGAANAWILRERWDEFMRQLSHLERDRAGEARLESITGEELRVRLFALDRAGHLAAEGQLTSYFSSPHAPQLSALKFAAIEFDPSLLPPLIRELAAAAQ